MSKTASYLAIEGLFLGAWTGTPAGTVQVEASETSNGGKEFTQPDDAAWLRFSVRNSTGPRQVGIGADTNYHLNLGFVQVEIFTPKNEGFILNRQLADLLPPIFKNASPGADVRFTDVFDYTERGIDDLVGDGAYSGIFRAEFEYYELL